MSTCKSSSADTLNAMHPADSGEGQSGDHHTVTLKYGPYMNWGRWNHNTSRINGLIQQLNGLGFNVQLQHDAKETSWEEHGYVTITYTSVDTGEEVTLCHADRVQHNRGYSTRQADLAQMVASVKKAMEGLTSAKGKGTAAESASSESAATTMTSDGKASGKASASALSIEAKM